MGSQKRGKGEITGFRIFVILVVAMVAAVVGTGLYLAGSPNKERQRRFDQQRLNDMQTISSAVDAYYNSNGRTLPASLAELVSGSTKNQYYVSSTIDPETGVPYEYSVTGDASYSLCAVFDLTSDEDNNTALNPKVAAPGPMMPAAPYGTPGWNWDHPAGHYCYPLQPSRTAMSCTPMRETATGRIDCYGCSGKNCKTAPSGWEAYVAPANSAGIMYSCYDTDKGCALAQ